MSSNRECKLYGSEEDSGSIAKSLKARFVAQDFQQVNGIEYGDTCVWVVKATSTRAQLSSKNHLDLALHQMDFVSAFSNVEAVDRNIRRLYVKCKDKPK